MTKLSKPAAAALVEAHVDYLAAKAALAKAEAHSKELRKKHRARVPYGAEVEAGGYRFKRSEKSTGQRFSLGAYLKRHKLTAAMRPFVSEPTTYDLWDIQAIAPEAPSIEALVKAAGE